LGRTFVSPWLVSAEAYAADIVADLRVIVKEGYLAWYRFFFGIAE
jgi:hypothetical protein